nr:peptidoglycan DD-metalloendopeptidase family protein [Parahaliea mediterranea]
MPGKARRSLPGTVLCVMLVPVLVAGLAGCGGNPRAPVEDRNRPASSARPPVLQSQRGPAPGEYRVVRGDTLYSIAFRYGFDFRALAAANRIAAPYTIYPGQTLKLREAAPPAKPVRASSPAPSTGVAKTASAAAGGKPSAVTKGSSGSGKTGSPAPARKQPAPAAKPPAPQGAVSRWRWPSDGRVIRGFSATVHKGIDIGGNRGEAVRAVADGVVVYAGTGIVGLGELLIVKHNDTYLSAYGHNDRLLVREGAAVRAGEKIAVKGSSGTDTVKLHFEIRKEGKPVDPLRLLPKR